LNDLLTLRVRKFLDLAKPSPEPCIVVSTDLLLINSDSREKEALIGAEVSLYIKSLKRDSRFTQDNMGRGGI
jgi:hypothetical protein